MKVPIEVENDEIKDNETPEAEEAVEVEEVVEPDEVMSDEADEQAAAQPEVQVGAQPGAYQSSNSPIHCVPASRIPRPCMVDRGG